MSGKKSEVAGMDSCITSWKTVKESSIVMANEIFSPASAGIQNTSSCRKHSTTHGMYTFTSTNLGFLVILQNKSK